VSEQAAANIGEKAATRLMPARRGFVPAAGLVWLALALVLFAISDYEFSLNERQTRPRIAIERVETENPHVFILYTTGQFFYGDINAPMLPNGDETYASRDEGLQGSALARMIFESDIAITGLSMTEERIVAAEEELEDILEDAFADDVGIDADEEVVATQGEIVVTFAPGSNIDRALGRIESAINTYFPRAGLAPNLWLPNVTGSDETVLRIQPIDTGVLLMWFALAYAAVETGLAFLLRTSGDKLIAPLVRAAGVFLLVWSFFGHMPLWDYLLNFAFPTSSQLFHPSATVIGFTAQHLELVIVSSFVTVPLGLLIGILVTREAYRDFLPLANNIVNSGQTIPTLAVVAIMAPIIGFGFWPAIIALVLYGLLPVVRNTITGLENVDSFIIDSAKGMGLTNTQILFQIEIPIASRIIMAGIRTSMVINVGTATLGAFVGSGGLGVPIASGLSTTTYALVLLGALPAALLAILIDYVLGRVEFVATPKGLQIEA
jgi:osmoprotectant transport system permease protein